MVHFVGNISNGILVCRPGSGPLGKRKGWDRGQHSNILDYGHVAYQIEGNDAYRNMVANIFP